MFHSHVTPFTLFDPEEILTYFVDDLTVISLIVTLCGVMRIMAVIIKADIRNYVSLRPDMKL